MGIQVDKDVMRDWELLAMTDHYHTAVAIREALQEGCDVRQSGLNAISVRAAC